MTKAKYLIIAIFTMVVLFLVPSISNAAVSYERSFPSNDGTIKIKFSGLTLDENKSYEFALVRQGTTPTDWFSVDDGYTATEIGITLSGATQKIANVLMQTDTGFVYIREKDNTTDPYVLENQKVNLKLPYLQSLTYDKQTSRYTDFGLLYGVIGPRYANYASHAEPYSKWQKVTDKELVNKFLSIKKEGKDISELESILPNPPTSGYGEKEQMIYFTSKNDGLYLLWIKRTAENCKDVISCIVHDGLPDATTVEEYLGGQSETVAVASVSVTPSKLTLEVGKTYSLTVTVSPSNVTNKIVTWTSSDESVATVDTAGRVTAKKVGSVTITATTQDGNKKATCTVTVVNSNNNTGTEDTKQYLSFPYVIFNGTSSITVKNYTGNYKLYYQFVEVTDKKFSELTALKEEYKNSKITYAEFLTKYKQTLPQYNEKDWVETKDGKFKKDLSGFTGTKKFALWGKLVMDTKTVYEAEIYSMDGSGKASNIPDETDKITDNTKATGKLPQTGIGMGVIVVITITALCGGYAFIRTNKLRDI